MVSGLLARPDVSLLTLTGPGGCGKTRLALEVARLLGDRFPDGTVFVGLAGVEDAGLVASTIAARLGLPEAPGGTPEDALVSFLASRRMLLVLDNFEHLLGAIPLVATLLESVTGLKIMITSRTPLRLRVEREFPLDTLACPPVDERIGAAEIEDFPAVKLFLDRARVAQAEYSLTDSTATIVAEICRRLDGLPLAIELAAARSRLLSAPQLLSRLEHGLDVLGTQIRDLPERQRTVAATIDWSYRLLDEPARTLFRRLAVFAGGWTLEAAEEVCTSADEGLDFLEAMESLLEASLVQRREGPDSGLRFSMLQTVRECAAARLRAAGPEEERLARRRHGHCMRAFSERASRGLRSADRVLWSRRIECELDNVRGALSWSSSPEGDVGVGVYIAWHLLWFVEMRSVASEALFWIESLGSRLDHGPDPAVRGRWLLVRGALAFMGLEAEELLASLDKAFAVLDGENDPEGIATAMVFEGMALTASERNHVTAQGLLRQAIPTLERIGDTWGTAFAYYWLTYALLNSNVPAEAWQTSQSALALFRETGDPWGEGLTTLTQALVHSVRDNLAASEASMKESLRLLKAAEDVWLFPWVTAGLGLVSLLTNKTQEAEACFRQALVLGRDYSNDSSLRIALAGLAGLAAVCWPCDGGHGPDPRRAARLLGAAAGRSTWGSLRPWPGWDQLMERLECSIRPQLDQADWEREYAAGQGLTKEAAISFAES